jgi:hypothetical protein
MRLLVSVADAGEARAAIEGGADVIDAKDPSQGALGAVSEPRLREIVSAVARARPISVALGDVGSNGGLAVERLAAAAASFGVDYVKVGFGAEVSAVQAGRRVDRLIVIVAGVSEVILAAYGDARDGRLDLYTALDVAARAGAAGVLLDTLDKRGVGLFDVLSAEEVEGWVAAAHAANLMVAVAGSLREADLAVAYGVRADLVGVRGAACDGGRGGCISATRVQELALAMRSLRAQGQPCARDAALEGARAAVCLRRGP